MMKNKKTGASRATLAAKADNPAATPAAEADALEKTAAEKTVPMEDKPAAEKASPAAKTAKPAAKKSSSARKPAVTMFLQYQGKQTSEEEMIDSIQRTWRLDNPKVAIKTLDLYIKPEDNAVYYVINGAVSGFVPL